MRAAGVLRGCAIAVTAACLLGAAGPGGGWPLFLGGEDSLDTREVSDMEVYWDMTDQLWEAVKDLPEGTKIGNVMFE